MIRKPIIQKAVFKRAENKCEVPECNNEASVLHYLNDVCLSATDTWNYAAICNSCLSKAKHIGTNETYNKLLREHLAKKRINENMNILFAKFDD